MREWTIRHSTCYYYIDVFWFSASKRYVTATLHPCGRGTEQILLWLMYLWERSIVLIATHVYTGYFRYTTTNPLLVRVFSDSLFTCRQSVASSTLIVSVKVELIRATR